MLLLMNLAGYGTVILDQEKEGWESIYDCFWDQGESEEENTDIGEAFRIAEIMARPFMPASRILNLADKWTLEMLRMPAVWSVVKNVAEKLIKEGEIKGDSLEELTCIAYDSSFPNIFHLIKWKRRLLIKPGELDNMTMHFNPNDLL